MLTKGHPLLLRIETVLKEYGLNGHWEQYETSTNYASFHIELKGKYLMFSEVAKFFITNRKNIHMKIGCACLSLPHKGWSALGSDNILHLVIHARSTPGKIWDHYNVERWLSMLPTNEFP